MEREKSCGCIIVDNGKVLLIGAKDDKGEMFWSFPKGHQESGETDTETAIRETKEEIGLDVEVANPEPIVTGHYVHGGTVWKEIRLFIAKPVSEDIALQEEEVELTEWVSFEESSKRLKDYYLEAWNDFLNKY